MDLLETRSELVMIEWPLPGNLPFAHADDPRSRCIDMAQEMNVMKSYQC